MRNEGSTIRLRSVGNVATMLLVLIVTWCIWSESFDTRTLTEGFIFGAISLVFTNRFVLRTSSYTHRFAFRPLIGLRYLVTVIVQIYKSGIDAIRLTLAGRLNVGIVDIKTWATDPLRGTLIANAITLTPGTVTIEYDEGHLKVVWINCTTSDPDEAGELIKGSFERVFAVEAAEEDETR